MAFHVACPITCRRICFCTLGFPQQLQGDKAREGFLDEVFRVEDFLRDNWIHRVRQTSTVQVTVPRVTPPPPPPPPHVSADGIVADTEEALLSAQTKRAALQRKAAAALVAAEDYARRFEAGNLASSGDVAGEGQGNSSVNVMCRLCFSGEHEGSEKVRKMLSCKSCGKKYHRNCLKLWAQNRDLFHWSSWTCPSCRICEVCRRTGDPNKFMFCKRCDAAYHCYCQHPPHKNVSSGPYLCAKHTRCHSCGSTVPGNGLSTRWFLGYMCCDACGRLFVKGNYCPVCLKVYRDSESTPMVCCDFCQRWVHCQCDSISDEKYHQFQVDGDLHYKCATCRGECYQVKDLDNAVRELWRRRDEADKDLIANLRSATGLPTQEEIFSISPYSDDEENVPVMLKDEYGRALKLSLKGFVDKSPKKAKEPVKKSSSKKHAKKKSNQTTLVSKAEPHGISEWQNDSRSPAYSLGEEKTDELLSHRFQGANVTSPVAGSLSHTEGICSINQSGVLKHKFVDEIVENNEDRKPRVVKIKSSKLQNFGVGEDAEKQAGKSKTIKGTKLVIHLGARGNNLASSPMSDGSSCRRDDDMTASNGSGDTSHLKTGGDYMADGSVKPGHGGAPGVTDVKMTKVGVSRPEASDLDPEFSGRNNTDGDDTVCTGGPETEGFAVRTEKAPLRNHPDSSSEGIGRTSPKDSRPLLKLKFKNPYCENQSSWGAHLEDEKSCIKGQRSKRKRPSPYTDKAPPYTDKAPNAGQGQEDAGGKTMDASWILKTLGTNAIGKRVEVHQQSDNSWHKGVVTDVGKGASMLSIRLDDGWVRTVVLGKQGIRLLSQKKKRSKA